MLTSLALVFLVGMLLARLAAAARLPGLLGMLLTGILLGPRLLNLIDPSLLAISPELRQLALVVILTRAGLGLDLKDLRRVGRPALLLCFVPACAEMTGMVLLAPPLLGLTRLEAAILGSVVAAVSPAVIVPRMLRLQAEGLGTGKGIPQMIMAGASVDDVFVIVLFTGLVGLESGGALSPARVAEVPVSILTGVLAGWLVGLGLAALFRWVHMRDTAKVLVLLSAGFLLVAAEQPLTGWLPFSGLLAVMAAGAALLRRDPVRAGRLSLKFQKLWVAAELLLFVLVGAGVDPRYLVQAGPRAALLLALVLLLRAAGVQLCLLGAGFTRRERAFCALAYLPKATVQAAIGGVPLAMGLACGETVLTVAVLAILFTAPLGALGIDLTAGRWLERAESPGRPGAGARQ